MFTLWSDERWSSNLPLINDLMSKRVSFDPDLIYEGDNGGGDYTISIT